MDPGILIGIAGLAAQLILVIFLIGQWKGTREHSDETLIKKLQEECEARKRSDEDISRRLGQLQTDFHLLREKMQVYEVRMAVIRTQLKLPPGAGET